MEAGAHSRAARGEDDVNMHPDLSFLVLIQQASVVVQAVLVLLAAFSLWS